jgi:hypothetical protein
MRADPEVSPALDAALAGLVGAVERARGTA